MHTRMIHLHGCDPTNFVLMYQNGVFGIRPKLIFCLIIPSKMVHAIDVAFESYTPKCSDSSEKVILITTFFLDQHCAGVMKKNRTL